MGTYAFQVAPICTLGPTAVDKLDAKRELLDRILAANQRDLRVEQVMTKQPVCIDSAVSAYDLVQTFHAKGFRHLLVTDAAGRMVGVISDRDVLRCFGIGGAPTRSELEQIKAADLMSTDVITVEPQLPLADAVSTLLIHGINCLPVVSDGKLCGIITSTDVYLIAERMLRQTAALQAAKVAS
jgi:CBS domain-containing protein